MHEFFRFLSKLIPAAVILLPILFYYLHKRNILKTKKELLLKEIENGSIVDPEMLAKSLTNPVSEEQRLQNSLRCGIIFTIAGVAIALATVFFYSYWKGLADTTSNGAHFAADQIASIMLVVTLVLVVAGIALGVGIAFLVSYFNQKKRTDKTA